MTRMMRVLASIAIVLPMTACVDDPGADTSLPNRSGAGDVPCWKVDDESAPRTLPATLVNSMDATFELAVDDDQCIVDEVDDLGIDSRPAKFSERSQGPRFQPPP